MNRAGAMMGLLLFSAGTFAGCTGPGEPAASSASSPSPPASSSAATAAAREEMVRDQIERRGVRDPRVLAAMRRVPRDAFVPESVKVYAYDDQPLPIGLGQTISQPYIVALMTEQAEIEPGDRVLEVGTGSGYQAAVLAEVVWPSPEPKRARAEGGGEPAERAGVFSIELLPELGKRARARLDALGYGRIETRVGDGYKGWPERAPFDAILVTAAAPAIPPALVDQLATGGRLVIPVGPQDGVQVLYRVTREADGTLERTDLGEVRFVPLVPGK